MVVRTDMAETVPRLTLITRAECGLCEEMHAEIEQLRQMHPLPALELVDVDEDTAKAATARRAGAAARRHVACQQQLDAVELPAAERRARWVGPHWPHG
jgi:hypothetical protein